MKDEEVKEIRERINKRFREGTEEQAPGPYIHAGWLCPKCGRGNAPFSISCPCVPMPPMVPTC